MVITDFAYAWSWESISYDTKDFTGRPLDELKFVVSANLYRRHLDEFQRAEVAIKYDKLYRKIARERYESTLFDSESAREAAKKRHQKETEDFSSSLRSASGDASGIPPAISTQQAISSPPPQPELKSSQELAKECGVSSSTIERVRTILEQATPEQIQSIRDKSEAGQRPGVRSVFQQVQTDKLKNKLQTNSPMQELRRDNLKLINRDFRTISREDIHDGSVDLVLVLDFPEPRITEDQGFRIYEQLMKASCDWLRDGGMLAMHVEQRYLPRAICEKPSLLQFYHIISISDEAQDRSSIMFQEEWQPLIVYVKGVRDTQPATPQKGSTDTVDIRSDVYADEQDFSAEMIKRLSPSGSTIVEPFMGQSKGMTGMAAIHLGRTYIGIERDATQFLFAMNMLYEDG